MSCATRDNNRYVLAQVVWGWHRCAGRGLCGRSRRGVSSSCLLSAMVYPLQGFPDGALDVIVLPALGTLVREIPRPDRRFNLRHSRTARKGIDGVRQIAAVAVACI